MYAIIKKKLRSDSTPETDKEKLYILYKFFKYNQVGQSLNVEIELHNV